MHELVGYFAEISNFADKSL